MNDLINTTSHKISKWLLYTSLLLSLVNFTDYARTTESLPSSVFTEQVISKSANSTEKTATFGYFFLHSPDHQNFQSISTSYVLLPRIYSNAVSIKFRQQKLNQYSFNHHIYSYLKIISSEVSTENPPHSRS